MSNPIKVVFDGGFEEMVKEHLGGVKFSSLCDTSKLLNESIDCWGDRASRKSEFGILKICFNFGQ